MRFALDVAPVGDFADPAVIVRLARVAEAAGWDGLSTWDVLGVSIGSVAADPFIALAGVAAATERLRLITSVIVLPRRRPHLVAQAASTLDRLSGGRLVLGVGAGADRGDFERFGEAFDREQRIARFDAGLALVDAYLRGDRVDREGIAFAGGDSGLGPRSIQQPRPPIWVGGMRPGALRRAASRDGWVAVSIAEDGRSLALAPDGLAERVERLAAERAANGYEGPFDVAVFGNAGLGGFDVGAYADAGATWWLESVSPMRGSLDEILAIVEAGPPGSR